MKREIKFRAFWRGEMAIQGNPDLETLAIFMNYYGDCDLMQFIGLKDKNGKDIYEGDILEFPFEMGIAYVINDGFRFAVKSPGSGAVDYENEDVFESSIIIGNIYENPELIKP